LYKIEPDKGRGQAFTR